VVDAWCHNYAGHYILPEDRLLTMFSEIALLTSEVYNFIYYRIIIHLFVYFFIYLCLLIDLFIILPLYLFLYFYLFAYFLFVCLFLSVTLFPCPFPFVYVSIYSYSCLFVYTIWLFVYFICLFIISSSFFSLNITSKFIHRLVFLSSIIAKKNTYIWRPLNSMRLKRTQQY
jgi:hypothetical protein